MRVTIQLARWKALTAMAGAAAALVLTTPAMAAGVGRDADATVDHAASNAARTSINSPAAVSTEAVSVQFHKIPIRRDSGSFAVSAAAGYPHTCFGYTGNFRFGSRVMYVNWGNDASAFDECFGIAPDRTIWHAWPNSGGWKVMPHNGRADDTQDSAIRNGMREVVVWVNNIGTYCAYLTPNGWGPWGRQC